MIKRAQGTIEYLIILAVIVVISMIAVSFSIDIFGGNGALIQNNTSKLSGYSASSGITITDSVVDVSGEGVLRLGGTVPGGVFVTSIGTVSSSGDVTGNSYDSIYVAPGEQKSFALSELENNCACANSQAHKECTFEIGFRTSSGLDKKQRTTAMITCVTSSGGGASNIQQPIAEADTSTPNILLAAPSDGNYSHSSNMDFNFYVSDNNAVRECLLLLNNASVATLSQVDTNAYNTITYSLSEAGEGSYSWDVNCGDYGNNYSTLGTARSITFTTSAALGADSCWSSTINPHPICNCRDLNAINGQLSWSYKLLADINCYADTHLGGNLWENGKGFYPIGGIAQGGTGFSGDFNGAGKTVSGIFVDRTQSLGGAAVAGLFGYIQGGTVRNVTFRDYNIFATDPTYGGYVGGIAGRNTGTILNSAALNGTVSSTINHLVAYFAGFNSGTIRNSYAVSNNKLQGAWGASSYYIAGFVNTSSGTIENSYVIVNNDINSHKAGGFVGNNSGTIRNSFSTGANIYANTASNGMAGGFAALNTGTITNSFSTNTVLGGANRGGLVGWAFSGTATDSYFTDSSNNNAMGTLEALGAGAFYGSDHNHSVYLSGWTFGNDANWTARDGNFPLLSWQQ